MGGRGSPGGSTASSLSSEIRQQDVLPDMQEAIKQPTLAPEAADGLSAAALRAEAWAGEPFLHPDEDASESRAEGTARRRALGDPPAESVARAGAPLYGRK